METCTATYPDPASQRLIDAVGATGWRVTYNGKLWPVRVLVPGSRLARAVFTETTLVLFDEDSRPAHRFPLSEAEIVAGLRSAGPSPLPAATPPASA